MRRPGSSSNKPMSGTAYPPKLKRPQTTTKRRPGVGSTKLQASLGSTYQTSFSDSPQD